MVCPVPDVSQELAVLIGKLDGKIEMLNSSITLQNSAIERRFDRIEADLSDVQTKVQDIDAGRRLGRWLMGGIPVLCGVILWLAPFLATYNAN